MTMATHPRLGLLLYGLDRPLTGISRYTLELARALAELHPRPAIHILAAGPLGPLAGQTPFPVHPLPGCRLLPFLLSLGSLWLPLLARRFQLDLLHDPTGSTPFLFGSAQAKLVVNIHDVFPWSFPGHSSPLDTFIYRHWLPWALPHRADQVITCSQQSQADIHRYLRFPMTRIQVIHYGLSSIFQPVPREKAAAFLQEKYLLHEPYLLFLGSLTRRKNLARALQAFTLVARSRPGLRFVLVGPRAWLNTPVEQIVRSLQIEDRIQLTGPVPDTDLPYFYSAAQAFVFPSLYEGFGFPPLEAMACGTPVITSNCSSLPEVAGDAALLVDPTSIEAIAGAIEQVLSDPSLADELRQRGLQQAARFSWPDAARATLTLYQNVLQQA